MTTTELLGKFSQASAVANGDQFLIQAAGGVGNKAVKVTAETVRAYLLRKFSVGELVPELRRGEDGIYFSIDGGKTWSVAAYFTDFGVPTVETNTIYGGALNSGGTVGFASDVTVEDIRASSRNGLPVVWDCGDAVVHSYFSNREVEGDIVTLYGLVKRVDEDIGAVKIVLDGVNGTGTWVIEGVASKDYVAEMIASIDAAEVDRITNLEIDAIFKL